MPQVFEAITTIHGLQQWWTISTSGDASPGGVIHFDFGEMTGPDMKVTMLREYDKVQWECVESPHGWLGHTFSFSLDEDEGKTRLRFSHDGWNEQDDFYALCSFSWGKYLESLRQYCQTGKGEAFGSENYRS